MTDRRAMRRWRAAGVLLLLLFGGLSVALPGLAANAIERGDRTTGVTLIICAMSCMVAAVDFASELVRKP